MAETTDSGEISLQIVTPTGSVAETTVELVSLPGAEGEFGVLPGHSPFFTQLRPGLIRFEEGGMPRAYAVSGGYVEVHQTGVNVLARTCETKDAVDIDRATKARDDAATRLEAMSLDDATRPEAEHELNRAEARLALARGEGYDH